MLTALQIVFPILLLACVAMLSHALTLFDIASKVAHLSGMIALALFLVYIYTGFHVNDPDTIRQFFIINILANEEVLLDLCVLLVGILAATILVGVASETIVFVPDVEADVEVYKFVGKERRLLGITSKKEPLKRRFLSGNRRFQFSAEGFHSITKDISIRIGTFTGKERRFPIKLPAEPNLILLGSGVHNLEFDYETVYSSIQSAMEYTAYMRHIGHIKLQSYLGIPLPPKHFKGLPAKLVWFKLTSSSLVPLSIQNIFMRVIDVNPLKMSTFPGAGGGMGIPSILGYVRLRPKRGIYKVETPSVGSLELRHGYSPDKLEIYTFCERGYRYSVQLEVKWIDVNNPGHENPLYPLSTELQLDFPEIVKWQDLVCRSQNVKIFFRGSFDLSYLIRFLQSLNPSPHYTVLTSNPVEGLDNVAQIPKSCEGLIASFVGGDPSDYPPDFFIIDGRLLLLQHKGIRSQAEIIEDKYRVAAFEAAYDALAKQAPK